MTTARRHVVGVVGNDITHDARVRKVAAAAAAAGFKSTIVCYTPDRMRRQTSMGAVEVIRVPVPFQAQAKNGRVPARLRPFNGAELVARHAGPRTHLLARRRWLVGAIADPAVTGLRRAGLTALLGWTRLSLKIRHETFRLRRRGHVEADRVVRVLNRSRVRATLRLFRRLRDPVPNIADYEAVFGPMLEELKPDLIHAHDYHMIGIAVTAARNLRRAGHETRVVYDAHEWIPGLSYPRRVLDGWSKLEERFIHHVDAVIGVSPEQVIQIRDRYRLRETPTVVLNAPVTHGATSPGADIRSDLGIEGRIIAYHGNAFRERGLGTLVEALTHLDADVHAAILAPKGNPLVEEVEKKASELGVMDRVHVLPYVPADQLPTYLSGADLAVVPYLPTGNNDIALPNKLFEAIQADLPVLVSDMRSMTRLVTEHGMGEAFRAGDPEDLAAKAAIMLGNPELYRSRITAELKEDLGWDRQAEKLTAVYHRLLGVAEPAIQRISAAAITVEMEHGADRFRPTRLAVGPRNMAGQAFLIAAAVQDKLGIPAVSFQVEKPRYRFPVHIRVSEEQWRDPGWQAHQRRLLAEGFTHVVAESGTGLLGSMNGGFIDDQIEMLLEDGLKVALLLHGSEIRDPKRHRLLPYSPYASDDDLIRALEEASARLRRRLSHLDIPTFVTTPDLLEDVEATWLPVVVDQDRWAGLKPAFTSDIPTVLHLPTSNLLKGSEHIDPVLRRLDAEGRIRYLRKDGAPSGDVPQLIEQADIVVDQIVIGAYGLMSVQALAAGRITIANVRDTGFIRPECPIIHADPGTLGQVLEELLDDKASWGHRAGAGQTFVTKYHNGSATAGVLESFLLPTH